MYDFEVYDRSNSRTWRNKSTPTVTITQRGVITLSPAAMAMLGDPEAVVFLYAADERLIGFRKTSPDNPDGYPVRGRSGSRIVTAMKFCRYASVDISESRRYPLAMAGDVPCVDLKQPGVVVTSNRKGS